MVDEAWLVGGLQLCAVLVSLSFLRPALANRDQPGSRSFAWFVVAIAVWSLGLAGSNFSGDVTTTTIAYNVAILGAELSAATWLLLAVEVTTRTDVQRVHAAVLGGWIVLMQVAVWTNPLHWLFLTQQSQLAGFVFVPAYGPLFWVHAVIGYLLVLLGFGVLVAQSVTTTGIRRKQTSLFALAVVPLLGSNILALTDLYGPYDFTPIGFLLTAFVFLILLFRARFLDMAPIARRTAMARIHDAMVTLDEQNRVVDSNRQARSLFDIGETYVGMSAADFFSAASGDIHEQLAVATDSDTETTLTTRIDGDQRHFAVSIIPIEGAAERGRVVVLHDETAQIERERFLEHQNERLDEFAGLVSHELRNPLMVLNAQVELLESELPDEEFVTMREQLDRMDTMIDELLQMARAGRIVEDPELVAIETLAGSAWGHCETETGTLEVDLDGGLTVHGDRARLLHVLENLFRNALGHTTGGVVVRVGRLDTGFYVEDDGSGIPESDRSSLFDHGFTTSDSGTGLGLSLVAEIVEAHGWEIGVTDGPMGGARFEITNIDPAN